MIYLDLTFQFFNQLVFNEIDQLRLGGPGLLPVQPSEGAPFDFIVRQGDLDLHPFHILCFIVVRMSCRHKDNISQYLWDFPAVWSLEILASLTRRYP